MESNVKLTSLRVEANEAAAVVVVDGFGGGGANVGDELLLLEYALPSLPKA